MRSRTMVPTPEAGLSMKSPDTAPEPPRSEPVSGMKESVRPRGALGTACPWERGRPARKWDGKTAPDRCGRDARRRFTDRHPLHRKMGGPTASAVRSHRAPIRRTARRVGGDGVSLGSHARAAQPALTPAERPDGLVPAVREGGGLIRKSSRGGRGNAGLNQLDPFDCGAHPRCADEPPVTGDEDPGQCLRQRDVDGVIRGRNGARQVP